MRSSYTPAESVISAPAAPDRDTPHEESLARRAADPACDFIRVKPGSIEYVGELESGVELEEFVPFVEGEEPWESIGEPLPEWAVKWQEEQDAKAATKALSAPDSEIPPRNGEGDHVKHGGGAAASAAEKSARSP